MVLNDQFTKHQCCGCNWEILIGVWAPTVDRGDITTAALLIFSSLQPWGFSGHIDSHSQWSKRQTEDVLQSPLMRHSFTEHRTRDAKKTMNSTHKKEEKRLVQRRQFYKKLRIVTRTIPERTREMLFRVIWPSKGPQMMHLWNGEPIISNYL